MELWKPIKDFPDYEVSSFGNVKTNKRNKILAGTKSKGYHAVHMYGKEGKKTVNVHRLVATAFIKNPLGKSCINHKNGIKDDNRVENLEWASHSDNLNHAYKTGLRKKHSGLPLLIYRHQTQIKLFQ